VVAGRNRNIVSSQSAKGGRGFGKLGKGRRKERVMKRKKGVLIGTREGKGVVSEGEGGKARRDEERAEGVLPTNQPHHPGEHRKS